MTKLNEREVRRQIIPSLHMQAYLCYIAGLGITVWIIFTIAVHVIFLTNAFYEYK